MEVILNQDIVNLGYKNDIVRVKPGYARNFLLPKGLAKMATASNRKMLEENLKQAAHKLAKIKQEAEETARKLENIKLTLKAKSGTSGKIFGSITTQQVAQKLKGKGFEIDRKRIHLLEEIKYLGDYQAEIELHKEVKATLPIQVLPEEESKAEKK